MTIIDDLVWALGICKSTVVHSQCVAGREQAETALPPLPVELPLFVHLSVHHGIGKTANYNAEKQHLQTPQKTTRKICTMHIWCLD